MSNDKTRKTVEEFPVTEDTIRNCHEKKWFAGNYYSQTIPPQPVSLEMRERIVAALSLLWDKGVCYTFGTYLRVPYVTILPYDQLWPRLVVIFERDHTELRRNDNLNNFKRPHTRTHLIRQWDTDEIAEDLAAEVNKVIGDHAQSMVAKNKGDAVCS